MNKNVKTRRRQQDQRFLLLISLLGLIALILFLLGRQWKSGNVTKAIPSKTARVVANGDILLHDILYQSALTETGKYDFNPYFTYAKEWINEADLAIGDYEGTISPAFPLAGYPLFNAPEEIADTMKSVGYDVVDLAHNHILDSHLAGALNTMETFEKRGLSTIGLYKNNRSEERFLIREVNGIKIAILGYSYGYNGMEANLTDAEYQRHLSDLNRNKIEQEIKEAERLADVTIVMPQMGVEYALEPNAEQITLYHDMIDWGADVIFGGHPHVPEPAEMVTKDGDQKLIIYSMGNFISNQTYEMMGDYWPERGVLMDVTFEKKADKTIIKTAKAHPTMVWSWGKGTYEPNFYYELRNYRVLVLEDFISGGKYRDEIPQFIQDKVDIAYKEVNDLMNLNWSAE